MFNNSKILKAEKNNILANFDLEDKENILKNLKKKIRNLNATEHDIEPKNTMFGERRDNRFRSKSHGENRFRSKSGDRFRSKSNGREGNNSYRNRSGSRRHFNDRDNRYSSNSRNQFKEKPDQSPKYVKRTYTCENLKLNKTKSIFEAEVENKALVDSGCPEMVCGIDWMKTFEHSTERKYEELDIEDHFKFGNEVF